MNQVEDIVEAGGAGRLLFSTNFPYYEPHLSIGRLVYSSIGKDDKRKIASSNIERIFREINI